MKKRLASVFIAVVMIFTLALPAYSVTTPVTRGEFVTMVNEAYNLFTTDGNLFSDMELSHPYAYEMMTARRAGYLNGYADGSGAPDEYITRLETAVIISRVASLPAGGGSVSVSDRDEIPAWAAKSVDAVLEGGIMTVGENKAFNPGDYLTAAEAAELLELALEISPKLWSENIVTATSYDGYELTGRLTIPSTAETVDKIVLLVNGTGPNTYECEGFSPPFRYKYYDYFADELASDNIAVFSYNTRGVYLADEYPYMDIDWDIYETYTPQNCAKDVAVLIKELKNDYADAEIILLGLSEGAIIAPLTALEEEGLVDALMLVGYPDQNMKEILDWQLGGAQTFFYYTIVFDALGQDSITREQYEADPYGMIGVSPLVYDMTFEELDANENGVIDVEDFADLPRAQLHTELLEAIERGDTEWIATNFMALPAGWFSAHFELGRTGDILAQITDIPIHIFHGTFDLNCPVQGVYDVEAQFEELSLTNLTTHVFDGLDHSLGIDYWLVLGETTEGYAALFETAAKL